LHTKVFGSELETYAGSSNNTGTIGSQLWVTKLPNTGIIGQFYDQIALDINVAAGNIRLGCYDDSTGPVNLKSQTGSTAAATGYPFIACTEFALTTTQNWLALANSSASIDVRYDAGTATPRWDKSFTYGSLPDPSGASFTNNLGFKMKIGHS